jgi:large subunit ribosomal protein L15
MPKRGFNNALHQKVYIPVSLGALNRFADGSVVDENLLREKGLANGAAHGVKILAVGKLERRLTVRVRAFSKAARVQIETLGGVCETIEPAS